MDNPKTCESCIYYLAHYIKKEVFFQQLPLHCGHCVNRKNGRYRKVDSLCECYIEKDIRQEEQQQLVSAANLLKVIAHHLENLTAVLECFGKNISSKY